MKWWHVGWFWLALVAGGIFYLKRMESIYATTYEARAKAFPKYYLKFPKYKTVWLVFPRYIRTDCIGDIETITGSTAEVDRLMKYEIPEAYRWDSEDSRWVRIGVCKAVVYR